MILKLDIFINIIISITTSNYPIHLTKTQNLEETFGTATSIGVNRNARNMFTLNHYLNKDCLLGDKHNNNWFLTRYFYSNIYSLHLLLNKV